MTMSVDCPNCLMPYDRLSAEVVRVENGRRILHVTCRLCDHAMLLSIAKIGSRLACAGMLTDCSSEEAKRLLFGEKVTIDDVIHAHVGLAFDNFWQMR